MAAANLTIEKHRFAAAFGVGAIRPYARASGFSARFLESGNVGGDQLLGGSAKSRPLEKKGRSPATCLELRLIKSWRPPTFRADDLRWDLNPSDPYPATAQHRSIPKRTADDPDLVPTISRQYVNESVMHAAVDPEPRSCASVRIEVVHEEHVQHVAL